MVRIEKIKLLPHPGKGKKLSKQTKMKKYPTNPKNKEGFSCNKLKGIIKKEASSVWRLVNEIIGKQETIFLILFWAIKKEEALKF